MTASAAGTALASERLDRLLQRVVDGKRIRHAIAAIEAVDGSFRWAGAVGEAHPDGTPARADTPFFIASVTKLFIAAAVWKLHERGRLSVDEPMAAYLPPDLVRGLHRMRDGVDRTGAITLRHLLGHASGLPDYIVDRPRGGKSLLEDLVGGGGDRSWTIEDVARIVRETLSPHFPPQPLGTGKRKIRYSDTNYQLLMAVVEAVTGRTLDEAFEEMIYRPLGLERTSHPGTAAAERREERMATIWSGRRPLDVPLAMRSFRDLDSTYGDLVAFMRGLIGGRIFDDPATLDLMRSGWRRFGFSLNLTPVSPGWPIEYGWGMMRFRISRALSPFFAVPEIVGHTGITGSWLFHCPKLDLLLAGTVDQTEAGAVPFRLVPRMLHALEGAFK